ncbi:MAG: HemK2/MTQ2 family protein methyltransferase [Candidatus Thorarchaeota archaeon]
MSNKSENVYSPSDDSYLIIDYFKENITSTHFDGIEFDTITNVLDMGTGTGIIAIFLLLIKKVYPNFKPQIYASDIIEEAIHCAKLNEKLNNFEEGIIFLQSDLFKSFPQRLKQKFNIIIFNPPYLPSIKGNKIPFDLNWNGGVKGIEILESFLDEVIEFIEGNKKNYIYFISSSIVNSKQINKICRERGFIHKILRKKHVFFEDIILNRLEIYIK